MPNPSAAPLTMPASTASPELSAMVFCVVDQCLSVRRPSAQTPLLVDHRAARQLAPPPHPAKESDTQPSGAGG
eukprot:11296549-Alexandrium_andersonii.AAC.1